ncbi:extracellular solute-binding protein, partial [Shigella sonnei]|nr:extracellular solute-binding protein [Shigella sonnei]
VDKNDISVAGEAVSWKGKYYAYPQDQQSNIIFYNKAKFSEAPTSWTQFTQDKTILYRLKGRLDTSYKSL